MIWVLPQINTPVLYQKTVISLILTVLLEYFMLQASPMPCDKSLPRILLKINLKFKFALQTFKNVSTNNINCTVCDSRFFITCTHTGCTFISNIIGRKYFMSYIHTHSSLYKAIFYTLIARGLQCCNHIINRHSYITI